MSSGSRIGNGNVNGNIDLDLILSKISYLEKKVIDCEASLNVYQDIFKSLLKMPQNRDELKKIILDVVVEREKSYFDNNGNKLPKEIRELIEMGVLLTGPPGKEGSIGKEGPPGKPGVQGLPGIIGNQGPPGRNGIDGRDGINGIDGRDGLNGERGPPGMEGLPGPRGKKGPDGDKGESGFNVELIKPEIEKIVKGLFNEKFGMEMLLRNS